MFKAPADWPGPGPIDLAQHDLPHVSSTTEWWYVNTHIITESGRSFALFASFFRILKSIHEVTKEREYAHSLTWALIDLDRKKYTEESLVDQDAPRLGLEKVNRGEGTSDPRLRRAIREVLEQGKVPRPDRMFKQPVHVGHRKLELDFDGNRFTKLADGRYSVELHHPEQHVGCNLVFALDRPVVRHGEGGVVSGAGGEDMFYYFCPRCTVTGSIMADGVSDAVKDGIGWYDHEFGLHSQHDVAPVGDDGKANKGGEGSEETAPEEDKEDIAWNWLSAQLDNGWDISAYDLFDLNRDEERVEWRAQIMGPDGSQQTLADFTLASSGEFVSTRTFNKYPTAWRLTVPAEDIDLQLTPAFEDQEFLTVISKPAFWEGSMRISGRFRGEAVTGVGFVERSGFFMIDNLDDFFSAVGVETRKSVREVIPLEPDYETARGLIASEERDEYMTGVDVQLFADYAIKPVREVTDRGGKSWRSYAALACCDVVGGDSRKYVQWLAMPELMHTGSLIVDDVQDKSTVRRGGPTAHMKHGDAIAINSGTACYFTGQKILVDDSMSDATKVLIYDLYFEALRAGHAGQALDLAGLDHMMPEVVESGDSALMEERVLAVHRLKTAAPAASLARMGAVVGGGSAEQVEGVGSFFESVGLAFQIIDDVLNLRGFRGNLKQCGEDISHGKITLPVARAMRMLPPETRQELWNIVRSMPEDAETVNRGIQIMEDCGAIDACESEAREIVEAAWKRLDPLLEDSLVKLNLRAFGWYILERHY